jgi:hypothetical protein
LGTPARKFRSTAALQPKQNEVMTTTTPTPTDASPRPSRLRRITAKLGRLAAFLAWHLAGAWTTLGLFYTTPGPAWLRGGLAAAAMTLFIVAWRRRRTRGRWLIAGAAVAVAYAGYHFLALKPQRTRDWAIDHAVMPQVQIDEPLVRVRNARRFTWRSERDFTPGYYDAVYDLEKLDSMHYTVAPFSKGGGLAHVFLCFGFADGQHVAISVEARRRRDQAYEPVASLFRRYQLMYVVGDERDIVGLRGVAAKGRVQLYPARTTPPRRRAIFLDMMRRAAELDERPEFYNLATSNCMSNILVHLRRLNEGVDGAGKRPIPNELRLALTGFSDRVAYDLGYLDTDLPFAQAREVFRIDERIRRHLGDADFSQRIRAPHN